MADVQKINRYLGAGTGMTEDGRLVTGVEPGHSVGVVQQGQFFAPKPKGTWHPTPASLPSSQASRSARDDEFHPTIITTILKPKIYLVKCPWGVATGTPAFGSWYLPYPNRVSGVHIHALDMGGTGNGKLYVQLYFPAITPNNSSSLVINDAATFYSYPVYLDEIGDYDTLSTLLTTYSQSYGGGFKFINNADKSHVITDLSNFVTRTEMTSTFDAAGVIVAPDHFGSTNATYQIDFMVSEIWGFNEGTVFDFSFNYTNHQLLLDLIADDPEITTQTQQFWFDCSGLTQLSGYTGIMTAQAAEPIVYEQGDLNWYDWVVPETMSNLPYTRTVNHVFQKLVTIRGSLIFHYA